MPALRVADLVWGPQVFGSSPISNLTEAVGYVSEKWRGRTGSLERMPYLWVLGSEDWDVDAVGRS